MKKTLLRLLPQFITLSMIVVHGSNLMSVGDPDPGHYVAPDPAF